MNVAQQIAQTHLDVLNGGNWTDVSLLDTLNDVTVAEAVLQTKASPNTIASLVHHLAYWNGIMAKRVQGKLIPIPEENGFDVPPLNSENDWKNLIEDCKHSFAEVVEVINGVDEVRIWETIVPGKGSVYQNIQGSVEHIHYHLGQIVIIKKLIRSS